MCMSDLACFWSNILAKVSGTLVGLLFFGSCLFAQTKLPLIQCLELAVENNVQVKIASNSVTSAEITYVQKKFDFLPNVSMNLPLNKSFGNSADIFTQQIAVSPWTSQPSIAASLVAFRGFAKWNDLKTAEYNLSASQYSLEDLKNDIWLNTALAFFQVLFAADNLAIGRTRLDLLEKQLANVQKQFDAGAKTQGDIYGLQSQISAERVNAVTLQNAYDRSLLDLILTLDLDPSDAYEIVRPDFVNEDVSELEDLSAIFQSARLSDPGVRQQEFRVLAAKYAIRSARAAYFPTLNITFGLGSFYSSNAKETVLDTILFDLVPLYTYGDPIPMSTQFRDNFGKTLSFSLTVPIFNRMLTRQNHRLSKLNYNTAELNVKAEEMALYRAIQQAHLDAKAADAKYRATEAQQESLRESLRYAQARYDAGLLDFLSYLEVLNNSTRAEIEQVQAQYDRILKRKILDLYQGKPLSF
jgi:outer membrane protein